MRREARICEDLGSCKFSLAVFAQPFKFEQAAIAKIFSPFMLRLDWRCIRIKLAPAAGGKIEATGPRTTAFGVFLVTSPPLPGRLGDEVLAICFPTGEKDDATVWHSDSG